MKELQHSIMGLGQLGGSSFNAKVNDAGDQ